jgi:4-amino-4-deoxy-L-arabinose transferase-like glycosyltransferase
MSRKNIIIISAFSVLLLLFLLRLQTLFSRGNCDTSFYAFGGNVILNGGVPYKDFWELKTPLIFYYFALIFKLFGVHFFTIAVTEIFWLLITCAALYALAKEFFSERISLFLTVTLAAYSGASSFINNFGMTETYAMLPAMLSMLAVIRSKCSNAWLVFASGVAAGIAFLFRPTAAVVLLPALAWLICGRFLFKASIKRVCLSACLLAGGFLASVGLMFTYLYARGALPDFLDNVLNYGSGYYSQAGGFFAGGALLGPLLFVKRILFFLNNSFVSEFPFLLVFSLIGVFLLLRAVWADVKSRALNPFTVSISIIVVWLAADIYGIMYSGNFHDHYWIQAFPSMALLTGNALAGLEHYVTSRKVLYAMLAVLLFFVSPLSRQLWSNMSFINNFDQRINLQIGDYTYEDIAATQLTWIEDHTQANDPVYFWQAEPGLNFLLGRPNPSKYNSLFPLLTPGYVTDTMRDRFISDLENNPPKYIIDTSATIPDQASIADCGTVNVECGRMLGSVIDYIHVHYTSVEKVNGWVMYAAR